MKTATVIISKCRKNREGNWEHASARLMCEQFASLEMARLAAETAIQKGFSVVLRPDYNETDETGQTFCRKWRSFDGEPLQESRFVF